ncbi:MAG: hypothetical protein IPF98_23150 [Gemmatimonadetes bacterium]|nr:hypothetical protein [Gemmatimonadota bacterium]MCC6771843.1 hypothetical protein [Gemmatimonadaceae bacterium]
MMEVAIYLLAAGASLLAVAQLIMRHRDGSGSRLHAFSLTVFFVVLTLDRLGGAYETSELGRMHPEFLGLAQMVQPILPVALWIYVRALTESDAALHRSDWRHVIPVLLGALFYVPFLLLPAASRLPYLGDIPTPVTLTDAAVAVGLLFADLFWIGLLVGYGITIVRRLRAHRRRVRQLFSTLPWPGCHG